MKLWMSFINMNFGIVEGDGGTGDTDDKTEDDKGTGDKGTGDDKGSKDGDDGKSKVSDKEAELLKEVMTRKKAQRMRRTS